VARRPGLMHYTAIAFFLGVAVDLALLQVPPEQRAPVLDWMKALGDVFVRLMRIVIPLMIFFTISASVAYMRDLVKLRRILITTLVVFYSLAFTAVVIGTVAMLVIKPGVRVPLEIPGVSVPKPVSGMDLFLSLFRRTSPTS